MILCAGYGTRLGALTREIPKPMLPLAGHPMLAYIIAHLRSHGFDQLAVNLHFRPDLIRDYLGTGSKWKVSVVYSEEPQLLGTAGGLKKMSAFFSGEEAFLVHYGDIVTDQDFTAMLQFHLERRALATLLTHQRARSNSVLTLDAEQRITQFLERPDESKRRGHASPWVNSGVCICAPEFLHLVPGDRPSDLARDLFPQLVSTGRIYAFPLSGYRCAVDSEERLKEAAQALASGRCRSDLRLERASAQS